jgi:hypothetical protein
MMGIASLVCVVCVIAGTGDNFSASGTCRPLPLFLWSEAAIPHPGVYGKLMGQIHTHHHPLMTSGDGNLKKKKKGDLYSASPALRAALGAESRACYPGITADRQSQ